MQKKKWQLCAAAVVGMVVLFVAGSYGVTQLINKTYTMPEEIPSTQYPREPINLIVPFSAGGGMDLQARALEGVASRYLEQPVVIVNKPGGGGVVGWNETLNSAPDGYTLCMTSVDLLMHPLYDKTKYHYTSAFAPIAQISTTPLIMVVNAEQPWQNLEELIQYGKAHTQTLKYAHVGMGSASHLLGKAFGKMAGVPLEQVPFRGGSETVKAVLGNHVQIVFSNPSVLKELIKAGRLRALATSGEQRLPNPDLADIPTFKEKGLDLVFSNWRGVAVPKNTPDEIKGKLAEKFKKIALDPEVKKAVENMGLYFEYLGPEEATQRWLEESDRLHRMMEGTGIIEEIRAQKG